MHVDVLIDVGEGGTFAAWIPTMPDTLSRATSKHHAERLAVALFMEEIGRKVRDGVLLVEAVFPLHITPFDLDLLHCRCTCDLTDPHIRADHKRVAGPNGTVVYTGCVRPGCCCSGFASLWAWQEIASP